MSKVKMEWSRLTASDKVMTASYIINEMTANVAVFATPLPSLADVTTSVNTFSAALIAAKAGGTSLIFTKNEAEEDLNTLMGQLAAYVEAVSLGDAKTILLSGMGVRKEYAPTPDPTQILNTNALPARKKGQIDLDWDAMEYAKSYLIEQLVEAEDGGEDVWNKVSISTRSKISIANLITGKVYKFRVAAIGTGDRMGPFSQVVTSVAS